MKQFLLSLIATTISIILTFGTSLWLENRKTEKEKREIVMMVMHDISHSIDEMENADSLLRAGFDMQVAVAADPDLLEKNPFVFTHYIPQPEYTETVEHIFSSNIETINTIGSVEFAENVSAIYKLRKDYKKEICDPFIEEMKKEGSLVNYESVIQLEYYAYIQISGLILNEAKHRFDYCKKKMEVSDSELEAYSQKRFQMEGGDEIDSIINAIYMDVAEKSQQLKEAIEKGKQKRDKH